MHQSFPSVCGQPNLRPPTFGSAWAIDASVFSHRLQRRASSNAVSNNLLLAGMPRTSTLLVTPSGDSPSYSSNNLAASSFVVAILLRAPSNIPFGLSSFVVQRIQRGRRDRACRPSRLSRRQLMGSTE